MDNISSKVIRNIEQILDIPSGIYKKVWEFTDIRNDIYKVHYIDEEIPNVLKNSDDYEPQQFQNLLSLRGIAVDEKDQRIVSYSFGYTPTIYVNELPSTSLKIRDNNNLEVNIDMLKATLKTAFDGTLIQLVKHKGKCMAFSHRKLDISNSRFGNSDTFLSILLKQFNVPSLDVLGDIIFDRTKEYSNYVHVFMICDPNLQNNTKYEVGPGYVVYLAHFLLEGFDGKSELVNENNIEMESVWRETQEFFVPVEEPRYGIPIPPRTKLDNPVIAPILSVESANKILHTGYFDLSIKKHRDAYINELNGCNDPRILQGESIICEYKDNDGNQKIIRIIPEANEWRIKIIGNPNNPMLAFANLMDLVGDKQKDNKHKQKDTFNSLIPITTNIYKNTDNYLWKVANIKMAFVLAATDHKIDEFEQICTKYEENLSLLARHLIENEREYRRLIKKLDKKVKDQDLIDEIRSDKFFSVFFKKDGKLNSTFYSLISFYKSYDNYYKHNSNVRIHSEEDEIKSAELTFREMYGDVIYPLFKLINSKEVNDEV